MKAKPKNQSQTCFWRDPCWEEKSPAGLLNYDETQAAAAVESGKRV